LLVHSGNGLQTGSSDASKRASHRNPPDMELVELLREHLSAIAAVIGPSGLYRGV
jgi:hypothetical protein